MAHTIYICYRNSEEFILTKKDFDELGRYLTPTDIPSSVYSETDNKGLGFAVFSYSKAVRKKGMSVSLGNMELDHPEWWIPGTSIPDGSFSLFRCDTSAVELVTDVISSRTIWYIHTPLVFMASTSQRAIIACLGSYFPNTKVYPWVLSSGSIGPDLSWDGRIKKLRGDSVVKLDRLTWELSDYSQKREFLVGKESEKDLFDQFKNALEENFQNLDLEWSRWALALSGGYDSRYSMLKLKEKKINCITWCPKESLSNRKSDGYIAAQLSSSFGLPHTHFIIDIQSENVIQFLDKHIMLLEGRVDHIRSNLDGLERYKALNAQGFQGLIRSDAGYGGPLVFTEKHVRQTTGLNFLTDFHNIPPAASEEMESQEIPSYLHRREGESLETWRDRVYHDFRLPCIITALGDGRLYYLEQANPHISKRVVEVFRRLPDHLRINKNLFRKIVDKEYSEIPISSNGNNINANDLYSIPGVIEVFSEEFNKEHLKSILPPWILNYCKDNLSGKTKDHQTISRQKRLHDLAKRILSPFPMIFKSEIKNLKKRELPWPTLALRCYFVSRMHEILIEDAQFLKKRN